MSKYFTLYKTLPTYKDDSVSNLYSNTKPSLIKYEEILLYRVIFSCRNSALILNCSIFLFFYKLIKLIEMLPLQLNCCHNYILKILNCKKKIYSELSTFFLLYICPTRVL